MTFGFFCWEKQLDDLQQRQLQHLDEATIQALEDACGEIKVKGGYGFIHLEIRDNKQKFLKTEISIDLRPK